MCRNICLIESQGAKSRRIGGGTLNAPQSKWLSTPEGADVEGVCMLGCSMTGDAESRANATTTATSAKWE